MRVSLIIKWRYSRFIGNRNLITPHIFEVQIIIILVLYPHVMRPELRLSKEDDSGCSQDSFTG